MSSLFDAPKNRPTHDDFRQMEADVRGWHRRVDESVALLRRMVATDPARWPLGLDGIVEERLDFGPWDLFWNGTAETVPCPNKWPWPCPPQETWPRHAWVFRNGIVYGYWSDTAGWQDREARWLRALTAHVEQRERLKERT